MSEVQQKRSVLVVLCTSLLAGGEIRKCIEQATLPYDIELDYGPNPFLRTGFGDDLTKAPIDFTTHITQGSPIAGLLNPEARIMPVVPISPLRSGGLNVSVLSERTDISEAMAWSLRRQFHLAGCTRLNETDLEKTDEAVAKGLADANICMVVVRFLNPTRQMAFGDLTPRLAGMRRAPQR